MSSQTVELFLEWFLLFFMNSQLSIAQLWNYSLNGSLTTKCPLPINCCLDSVGHGTPTVLSMAKLWNYSLNGSFSSPGTRISLFRVLVAECPRSNLEFASLVHFSNPVCLSVSIKGTYRFSCENQPLHCLLVHCHMEVFHRFPFWSPLLL